MVSSYFFSWPSCSSSAASSPDAAKPDNRNTIATVGLHSPLRPLRVLEPVRPRVACSVCSAEKANRSPTHPRKASSVEEEPTQALPPWAETPSTPVMETGATRVTVLLVSQVSVLALHSQLDSTGLPVIVRAASSFLESRMRTRMEIDGLRRVAKSLFSGRE